VAGCDAATPIGAGVTARRELRVITPLTGAVDADGFYARCELADGTEVALVPRLLEAVALTVGPASRWTGWADEWMYADRQRAVVEYTLYAIGRQPDGWVRHVSDRQPTVRRRDCQTCGRVVEWAETADGENPPAPDCAHGADGSST
jgi:hypothetical protein